MPNDPSTPAGYVRLLITDTQVDDPATMIFTDEEIDAFLANNVQQPYRAAAVALETIATDQVLVLKVMKVLDLETDGSKVSKALLDRAALLRAQADDDPATADDDFAVAEFADPVFGRRERIFKGLETEGILPEFLDP